MHCPRCSNKLQEQPYSNIKLAYCTSCQGTWYYGESLQKLLKIPKENLNLSSKLVYENEGSLKCPTCDVMTKAKTFIKDTNLTIDQCPQCLGVWFDKGELLKTKSIIRKEITEKLHLNNLGKRGYFNAYPLPKNYDLPKVLPNLPSYKMEEWSEEEDEKDIERGVAETDWGWGVWLFTVLTGMPLEVYNPRKKRTPWVVMLFILINVLIYISYATKNSMLVDAIFKEWGAVPVKVMDGNWLSLFTCMFLHASPMHLIGNMLFLWIFGDNIEDRLGHFNFILFYIVSGLAASVAQIYVMSSMGVMDTPLVGASGAVAGIMGSYLLLFPKSYLYQTIIVPYPFKIPVYLYMIFWIGIQFYGHYKAQMGVAWWAHLGGFFVGLLITLIFYKKIKESYFTKTEM